MCALRIHFLDNAAGHHAELAATILSHTLNRQGLTNRMESGSVLVAEAAHPVCDDIYFLLDEELLTETDLSDACMVLVPSARPARTLRAELGVPELTAVDAEGIASDEGADPVIALLGAAARILPFLDTEVLTSAIWGVYDHHLPYAAHAAIRAFDLGYSQAQQANA